MCIRDSLHIVSEIEANRLAPSYAHYKVLEYDHEEACGILVAQHANEVDTYKVLIAQTTFDHLGNLKTFRGWSHGEEPEANYLLIRLRKQIIKKDPVGTTTEDIAKHLQRFYFNFHSAVKPEDWGVKWSQISNDPKNRASLIVLWVTETFLDLSLIHI